MADQSFQGRLDRLETKNARPARKHASQAPSPDGAMIKRNGGWNWRRSIAGGLASAGVLLLFVNIQTISDMAPESIKKSDMAGLYGTPIALLSIAWFLLIPISFVRGVASDAKEQRTLFLSRPFVTSAFAVLLVGLVFMKYSN